MVTIRATALLESRNSTRIGTSFPPYFWELIQISKDMFLNYLINEIFNLFFLAVFSQQIFVLFLVSDGLGQVSGRRCEAKLQTKSNGKEKKERGEL